MSAFSVLGDQSQQSTRVQVLFDRVGEAVQHGLPERAETGGAGQWSPVDTGLGGGLGEPGPAEAVVLEGAVPGGAPGRAHPTTVQKGLNGAGWIDGAVVDGVGGDG